MRLFGKELKFNNKDVALKEEIPTTLPASGGNSDTVDGKHASDFAPTGFGLGTVCVSISDWNNALKNGWYMSSNSLTNANAPITSRWFMGYTVAHNDLYIVQRVVAFADDLKWYQRSKKNGTWDSWAELKYTDTNTWRGVQDNLTSTATDQSLSANQGKILKGLIDDKANLTHTHTKAQITDFPTIPTKLSQLENDIGAGGGTTIITSATQPAGHEIGRVWLKII